MLVCTYIILGSIEVIFNECVKIFSHLLILYIHKIRMNFTEWSGRLRYHSGGYYRSGSMRKHPHGKGICHYCNNSVEEEKEIWACSELILLRFIEYRKWAKESRGAASVMALYNKKKGFLLRRRRRSIEYQVFRKACWHCKYLMAWGRLSAAWLVLRINCRR